jgi:predicted AAA+ superfamily ATPase
VVGKEKACSRTLSKQSLQGQVKAKLTTEICINNASSNIRMTAAGRQATAADTILRTVSRLSFFFLFFSLPLMREKLNYTCMLKNLLKLYCI